MKLSIKQQKISFLMDKYSVFQYDQLIYTAKTKFFSIPTLLELFNLENQVVGTVKQTFFTLLPKFELKFNDSWTIHGEAKSRSYQSFKLVGPRGLVEIHQQKGRKYAIIENNEQVAEMTKNKVRYFKGDEYEIVSNPNIEKEFLILLCLAWDMYYSSDSTTVFIDFGNIGSVVKEADDNWSPTR